MSKDDTGEKPSSFTASVKGRQNKELQKLLPFKN
jgi:hypothetical protein